MLTKNVVVILDQLLDLIVVATYYNKSILLTSEILLVIIQIKPL